MPESKDKFDVIIIGGGPAGLSAALWCCELGMKVLLLEKEAELGGQLLWTYNSIKNYLGIEAKNGREMRDVFARQIEKQDLFLKHLRREVSAIDVQTKTVNVADGTRYSASALIIATGVSRRILGIEGEEEFKDKGILESGAKEKESVKNKTVLIVGGGDAAFENSLMLSEYASKIYLVHRSGNFRACVEFIKKASCDPNIEFLTNTIVRKITGKGKVEAVELEDISTGERNILAVDAVLIRIGVKPNTELFQGELEMDANDYLKVNGTCETSAHGIFAAGDVAYPFSPTISTAVGTGAAATKVVFHRLRATG